jgi:hypothetical protein
MFYSTVNVLRVESEQRRMTWCSRELACDLADDLEIV